ncbi:MAG: DNA-binding protein [Ruminococcus sp.]|jgi:predicted DNA-binding protein YlxM (UPF0122 family)|nr:DNA-binding protein [Ruminococcus sp.]
MDKSKDLRFSKLLDFYSPVLTEKQQNAAYAYYNDDYSLGEIAENEGISRQGVRDNIKRAEAVMLELESQIHLLERAEKYFEFSDRLAVLVNEIDAEIKARGSLAAIHTRNENIKDLLNEYKDLF